MLTVVHTKATMYASIADKHAYTSYQSFKSLHFIYIYSCILSHQQCTYIYQLRTVCFNKGMNKMLSKVDYK